MNLDWMAWTWQTGLFFAAIFVMLAVMTVLGLTRPQAERVGVLGIATSGGDRLFLTLLGSAFIHLGWLGLVGEPVWGGSLLSLAYAAAVFRWV